MSELQFINAMSTKHRNSVVANALMDYANRQHYLSVAEAKQRKGTRADNRYTRSLKRAYILDTALMAATMIGIAVATWFLTSLGVL